MSTKIRVGVAGLGFIGPVHIESLRRIPGVEVVAVADSTIEDAQKKAAQLSVPEAFGDFGDMVSSGHIDAVHICTPNQLHYEMVKTALQAGIHVVCDKPLAMNSSQGQELVKLASASGLVHAINFNLRYYPLVHHMKSLFSQGKVGPLYSVQGSYLQDWLLLDTDYNWRLEKDQSGNSKAVADIGSHLLDLIEYVTGDHITDICADFKTAHPFRKKPRGNIETYSGKLNKEALEYDEVRIETEDYAAILLKFASGASGVAVVSQVAAGRKNQCRVEFNGGQASLCWNSESPNELWIGSRDEPNSLLMKDPALMEPEASAISSYPGGHQEGFADTSKQLFFQVYKDIRNGKPSENPSYPTFKDGLRELRLCDAIIASQEEQRWQKTE